MRQSLQKESLSGAERIVVERHGKISFVRQPQAAEASDRGATS
ncbi:hypothetical protein [Cupriavidus basilensis]|nr:hypothetical protein [Cupriavidus basilensis]